MKRIIIFLRDNAFVGFIKWIINLPKEIKFVEADPFIAVWKDNYKRNVDSKIFQTTTRVDSFKTIFNLLSKDLPIILLADGPSLDRDLKSIKKLTHKFFIVCQDAVLYNCLKNKIKPNLVVSLDPSILVAFFWNDLDTSDLTLVSSTTLHPEALKSWKGKILFFNQSDSIEFKNIVLRKITFKTRKYPYLQNSGWVGNTMFQVASVLNPVCIVLSGYDLAYTYKKYYCKYYLERRAAALGITKREVIKYEVKKEIKFYDSETKEYIYTSRLFQYYWDVLISMIKKSEKLVVTTPNPGILKQVKRIDLTLLEKHK
jgi:hypothetical protein